MDNQGKAFQYPAFSENEIKSLSSLFEEYSAERYINALKTALDAANEKEYSIGKTLDWCTCLMYNNNAWDVFFVDRGIRMQAESFSDINDACLRMIQRVSKSRFKERRIRKDYLKKVGTAPVSAGDLSSFFKSKTAVF